MHFIPQLMDYCSFKGARIKTEAHLGDRAVQRFKFNGRGVRAELKSIFPDVPYPDRWNWSQAKLFILTQY